MLSLSAATTTPSPVAAEAATSSSRRHRLRRSGRCRRRLRDYVALIPSPDVIRRRIKMHSPSRILLLPLPHLKSILLPSFKSLKLTLRSVYYRRRYCRQYRWPISSGAVSRVSPNARAAIATRSSSMELGGTRLASSS